MIFEIIVPSSAETRHTIERYSKFMTRRSRSQNILLNDIRNYSPVIHGDCAYRKQTVFLFLLYPDNSKIVNKIFNEKQPESRPNIHDY